MNVRARATFDGAELAIVLSHFDLGVVESITELLRGSRKSAKAGIVADRGKFLLKQRSINRVRVDRLEFSHRLQAYLIENGFAAPRLVVPKGESRGFVLHRDRVYELFEFVSGQPYSRSIAQSRAAGETLAQFHVLAAASASADRLSAVGDFHDAPGVRVGLCSIGSSLRSHDSFSGDEAELATLIQHLLACYERSVDRVNAAGFGQWPLEIVHADWHPGNILFREGKVAGVVDYDSIRRARTVTDVATGALHFSMLAGEDPTNWPDGLDEPLFHAFLEGYQSGAAIAPPAAACLIDLMAEALVAECVPPITETGSVGRWSGFRVLKMVRRKLDWMEANKDRLLTGSTT